MNKHEHEDKYTLATVMSPYPLEVVHVGGLYWGTYECQVVNFCRLFVSLV